MRKKKSLLFERKDTIVFWFIELILIMYLDIQLILCFCISDFELSLFYYITLLYIYADSSFNNSIYPNSFFDIYKPIFDISPFQIYMRYLKFSIIIGLV